MSTTNTAPETAGSENPTTPKQATQKRTVAAVKERFQIKEFTNRSGNTTAWRVTGMKRNGERVRKNYSTRGAAEQEKANLTTEYHSGVTIAAARYTRLTDSQIRFAETAYGRLAESASDRPAEDAELLLAVERWIEHGRERAVVESPRLDEAFEQFKAWLPLSGMRKISQDNLRRRVSVFTGGVPNLRLSDFTPEVVQGYLDKRNVSPKSRDNDRRALSGFFSWAHERPRKWIASNPCREIRIPQADEAPPVVLTVEECKKLLRTAEKYKGGQLAPYVAVCLFAGLRPFEAKALRWEQVNFEDNEIRLEANQTKTGRLRVVTMCPTVRAWLKAYKGKSFFPANRRKDFAALREAIGYGEPTQEKPNLKPWPVDVMRHSGISHFFRKTGSYGLTAEWAGNSEAVIKAHYQGRVSSADTRKFYALRPSR